jgi:hypothetical protein
MKSKKGRRVAGRKSDKKRLGRAVRAVTLWCRKNWGRSKEEQHQELSAKLRGHYACCGITFNFKSLERYFLRIREIWHKWLNRRSDKRSLYCRQYLMHLKENPLPYLKIVHSEA